MRKEITEKVLLEILSESKVLILGKKLKPIKSGEEFESILYAVMKEVCVKRGMTDCVRTGKQTFPDIYIWPYGVEAKFTIGDSWVTTGNSIVETTRVSGLRRVYMFFYKQGKKTKSDIKFRPYEECLSDIVVTHSPRYKINMELKESDSVFAKMGVDYHTFSRSDDAIKTAKDYYRGTLKKGEELWWVDSGVSPVIRNFTDLSAELQAKFKIEVMILFPEIFSVSTRKYVKPAIYLFQRYQATCSSLRDIFSAGGQINLKLLDGRKITVPKIFSHVYNHASDIRDVISDMDRDELIASWGARLKKSCNLGKEWLSRVSDESGLDSKLVQAVFDAGLQKS